MRETHRERPLRVRPPTSIARRQSVRSALHDTHHEWWFVRPLPTVTASPRAPPVPGAPVSSAGLSCLNVGDADGEKGIAVSPVVTRLGVSHAEVQETRDGGVEEGRHRDLERLPLPQLLSAATDPDVEVSRPAQPVAVSFVHRNASSSPGGGTEAQSGAGRLPLATHHEASPTTASAAAPRRPATASSTSSRFAPALLTDDVAAEADERYPIASLPFLSTRDPGEAISWPSGEAGAMSLLESGKGEESPSHPTGRNRHGSGANLRSGAVGTSSRKNQELLQANVSPTRRTARVILVDPDVGGLLYDPKHQFVVRFDVNDFVLRSSQVSIGEEVTYNRLYETSDVFRAVRLIRQGPTPGAAGGGTGEGASNNNINNSGSATDLVALETIVPVHALPRAGAAACTERPDRDVLQHSLIGAEYRSLYAKRVMSHEVATAEAAAEHTKKRALNDSAHDPKRAREVVPPTNSNASWLKVMTVLQGEAVHHTNFVKRICDNPSLLAEELDRETEYVLLDAVWESQRQKPPTSIFAGEDTRASDAALRELFARWEQSSPPHGKEPQSGAEPFRVLRQRVRQSCRWYRPKEDWFMNVLSPHVAGDDERSGVTERAVLESGGTHMVLDAEEDNDASEGDAEDDNGEEVDERGDAALQMSDGYSITISVPLATPRGGAQLPPVATTSSPRQSSKRRLAGGGAPWSPTPPLTTSVAPPSMSAKWEHERKVLVAERNPKLLTDGVVLEAAAAAAEMLPSPQKFSTAAPSVGTLRGGAAFQPIRGVIPPSARPLKELLSSGSSSTLQRPISSGQTNRPQRPQVWR